MENKEGLIWYNGNLIDWKDAKLHVLTHGLHYASSVFEGERSYSGRFFIFHEQEKERYTSYAVRNIIFVHIHYLLLH